jgi:hypothetical protein
MQSSTAIAFRALVMLIVLISVPLFAIFGKSLPDVVKGLLEGRTLVLSPAPGGDQNPPATAPTTPSSAPFAQAGPYRAATDNNSAGGAASGSMAATNSATLLNVSAAAPMNGNAAPLSAMNGNPPTVPTPSPLQPVPINNTAVGPGQPANIATVGDPSQFAAANNAMPAANFNANSVRAAATMDSGAITNSASPTASASTGASEAQPANFLSPPDAMAIAPADSVRRDGNMSGLSVNVPADSVYAGNKANPMRDGVGQSAPSASDEKFRRAEMRLRELGATHYMLETWGQNNSRYRFVCKMSVGGNAEVTRYFQAIDDNPWQAMQTVLEQVEDWRTRSQPQ